MAFLTTAQIAAIKPPVRLAMLFEARFVSGTMYLWNGVGDLTTGGHTYQGVGPFGEIEGLSQGRALQSSMVTARLSALTSEIINLAKDSRDEVAGRQALVSIQLYDSDWSLVGGPIALFAGIMQRMTLIRTGGDEATGGTRIAEIEIENPFVARSQPVATLFSDASQQQRSPGDKFFQWITRQNNKAQTWPNY